MQSQSVWVNKRDSGRLFPMIDRLYVLFIVLEFIAFPFVPVLPLVIGAAAFATPLRVSRWRMVTLLALGMVLTLIVIAPFILKALGASNFVE